MEKLSSKTVVKIGIVCHDVEDAVARFARLFPLDTPPHINPFDPNKIIPPGAYKRFRGKEYNIRLRTARVEMDPIYFEFAQPVDDTPSPWLEHLNKFGNSVCFVSFYVNGFRHEIDLMEKEGYPLIFEEEKGTERYAYFDTLEKLGIMVELKERDAT